MAEANDNAGRDFTYDSLFLLLMVLIGILSALECMPGRANRLALICDGMCAQPGASDGQRCKYSWLGPARRVISKGFLALIGVAAGYQLTRARSLIALDSPVAGGPTDTKGIDRNRKTGGPYGAEQIWETDREAPRILTVLTTYSARSAFVKPMKEAVQDRRDGDAPTIFVVSDETDENADGAIDYQTGTPRKHRLLPAIREACARYAGTFDWLAIGDDDTVFMYNRAKSLLKHIDASQPVAFARVDGLNPTASPCRNRACFSPEQKRNSSDPAASEGCCLDFTHPCEVPVYPKKPDMNKRYKYTDYGPGGLFWPYGGSGTFVSAGLAVNIVGGEEGWDRCSKVFGAMNTDVQFAQCVKAHGYSMGKYSEGFTELKTTDPVAISQAVSANCQLVGVHLGMKHIANGSDYTTESFRDAVVAVREEDEKWSADHEHDLGVACPEAWAALSKWT